MQGEWIRRSIGLKIIPDQCQPRNRCNAAIQLTKTGLSSALNSIEVNHHCPCALSTDACMRDVLLCTWSEPIRVLLEILSRVITLTLNRFRKAWIHSQPSSKALIQICCQIRLIFPQMTGSAGAVITSAPGDCGRLQRSIDRIDHTFTFRSRQQVRNFINLCQRGIQTPCPRSMI